MGDIGASEAREADVVESERPHEDEDEGAEEGVEEEEVTEGADIEGNGDADAEGEKLVSPGLGPVAFRRRTMTCLPEPVRAASNSTSSDESAESGEVLACREVEVSRSTSIESVESSSTNRRRVHSDADEAWCTSRCGG